MTKEIIAQLEILVLNYSLCILHLDKIILQSTIVTMDYFLCTQSCTMHFTWTILSNFHKNHVRELLLSAPFYWWERVLKSKMCHQGQQQLYVAEPGLNPGIPVLKPTHLASLNGCNRLNCALPKLVFSNLKLQCDCIWRWGLQGDN